MKLTHLAACAALACSFSTGASALVLNFEDLADDATSGQFYGLNAPGGSGSEFFGINKATTPPGHPWAPWQGNPDLPYNGLVFEISENSPANGGPFGSWFYTAPVVGGVSVAGFGNVAAATEGGCIPAVGGGCQIVLDSSLGVYSPNTPFYLNSLQLAANSSQVSALIIGYDANSNIVFQTAPTNLFIAGTAYTLTGDATKAISGFVVYSEQGQFFMDNVNITPVPEASTYAMMLAGLIGVGAVARRRAKKA